MCDSSYVFVYLLGTSVFQRKAITEWAKRKELTIVIIPNAIGQPDKMVSEQELLSGREYEWDYGKVDRILEEKRGRSERFLREALGSLNGA